MTSDAIDPYIFSTDTLPSDPRFLPPLTNERLGWRVFETVMHMSGVYNGERGTCHRADIPCPLEVTMKTEEEGEHTYTLDTHSGIFTHSILTARVQASQLFYAHRQYPNLLVMEVFLTRQMATEDPITVALDSSFSPHSDDIPFQDAPDYKGGWHIFGQTHSPEVPGGPCPSVHLIWTPVTPSVTLLPDQSQSHWGFLVAAAESCERVQACFDTGLELFKHGDLQASHQRAWAELWQGGSVELAGPEPLSRAVIGCMFYLLSAFPSPTDALRLFGGISPGGLSNGRQGQDYWGHVFWDQDTWMYPSIALFSPELARAVLDYRVRTIEGARANAQQQGCKGLKFPWESAVSGQEVCPEDVYGQQEIHINGDVAFAFQQYFYLTQDLEMFREGRGSDVVWGVADYWVSRVTWSSEDQLYHIRGVMPPDEYYCNVDNSVYTNSVAKNSLQFAVELANLLQHPAPSEWQDIADKLKIPFDPQLKYHPEFDGYKKGDSVKQADVVLLGYPLGLPMSPEVRKNDLEWYEAVTDPQGPAMTWGMFAVGWLELGETEKAQQLLEKCFKNIQGPFQKGFPVAFGSAFRGDESFAVCALMAHQGGVHGVWSESSDGSGAVNFLTGMGGFLQAVLFGYTGFRIQKDCLCFAPLIPDEVAALSVKGVSYLGYKLDLLVQKQDVSVAVRKQAENSGSEEPCPLEIVLNGSGKIIPLNPGQTVTFPRQAGKIHKQRHSSYCWPL